MLGLNNKQIHPDCKYTIVLKENLLIRKISWEVLKIKKPFKAGKIPAKRVLFLSSSLG